MGEQNPRNYTVAHQYTYTGYAKGYGSDEGTLNCVVQDIESVVLDVNSTYYRTETSDNAFAQNQLNSVYFAVPNYYFEQYEKLQRVKASWYQYDTQPIVVTNNEGFYDIAMDARSWAADTQIASVGYSLGSEKLNIFNKYFAFGWNINESPDWFEVWLGEQMGYENIPMRWVFYTEDEINEYRVDSDVLGNGGIVSDTQIEYMRDYPYKSSEAALPVKGGTIPGELFTDEYDLNRMRNERGSIGSGYCYYDFDVNEDVFEIEAWDEQHSFLENVTVYGFWDTLFGNIPIEQDRNFECIHIVSASDIEGSDTTIADRLFINKTDVTAFKQAYDDALANDSKLVLFRFSQSYYYSMPMNLFTISTDVLDVSHYTKYENQAYMAMQRIWRYRRKLCLRTRLLKS